jgi:C1A family cysteine protease
MTHNKEYKDDIEHEQRLHNFQHNIRYINSKNRAGLSYQLAVNHLADRSETELQTMSGCRKVSTGYNGGRPFNWNEFNKNDVPDQIDWRLYGAVTQVKDQAICGSCWSFGTTGAVEGAHFMKTGQLVRLSQQELIDCSWGEGNNGCDGGEDFRAYQWIMKHGLASEEDYGQYLAVDGYCNFKSIPPTAYMKGFVNVTSGDADALKAAIAKYGPVSVAIDAAHRSLSFYANGVYYEPQCGSKLENLDHAVLAVGYGVLHGEPYWLIKNSWSTYWGNDGYVLMSQRDNNCGVATSATYVVM